jgi:hypothetical protein
MKLLPCPFCGFDLPNVVQLNDPTQCEDGSQAIAGEEAYAVHCDGCGVWGPPALTYEAAGAGWDLRVPMAS